MIVENVRAYPFSDLVSKLREVRLVGFGQPLIYADSKITTRRVWDFSQATPAQNYVINAQVDRVLELRKALRDYSVNIFNLDGYVEYTHEGQEYTCLPPILESSSDAQGYQVDIVVDGMHRLMAARDGLNVINVIHIARVPSSYPYYAWPITWREVARVDKRPDKGGRKSYRREGDSYKDLFRDFNAVFPNAQPSRAGM